MPSYPIEHAMKTPELADVQRAGILGDNSAKPLKISSSRPWGQRRHAGAQQLRRRTLG
ncbi:MULTISPECIES: hypothetical protein [unclassified Bradyrhizobium]|uniref:hypothetical protein n=1 Tax=unclassified Bradyrhizobium TaxID=2631580 RepID=UPI00247AB459|nr:MULTISPECIES: hypothetical protein [unclassified Bradyrhizobium]WGR71327.1 hypothetical protein MTX24_39520 [Bradyrhizobium sp. ISRA426]WGR76162.1 hypothetical protein MTX21_24625 [Bradyrhizobium sp. ISRA430]WGR86567.1 hypothetical protein MTX25_39210 [Bradyrhizobium sp. ISRA432]